MPSINPPVVQGTARRRSRYGCRNCKLRKLKCDESKPQCRRCCSFGVLCNFQSNVSDLQPVAVRGIDRETLVKPPVTNAIWTADASTSYRYQLKARCQDFITRYLGRSLITPDDPNMRLVNRGLLELAFSYPCLMHASLAVSLTYDRYLNSSNTPRTLEECHHWHQSTILLNHKLHHPISEEDKDPIWGTAAALAILTFSSPEASTPEQAWPLKSTPAPTSAPTGPSDSELDWLRMSESKMLLWGIINPLRPSSLFRVMAETFAQMQTPLPTSGIEGMHPRLAAVCDLNESSTAERSPYFCAAHAVSIILDIPDEQLGTGPTQVFVRCICGPFRELLMGKDPVALLLLYLWYWKAGRCVWWIGLRARVEGPAIGMYLRRWYWENEGVMGFLTSFSQDWRWDGAL